MDNLAHTLAGAALAEAGLKEKTGLALPTLMIAANLPDLDALALIFGENLAFRRGITHGPLGLLILPPLLAGLMLLFDRWQGRRGTRPGKRLPVRAGWLVGLAYAGALTHPVMDWLNVYGIRCLAPFSDSWFYGDTLFIIDVWLWTLLSFGVVRSQRRRRRGLARPHGPALAAIGTLIVYIGAMGAMSAVAERATAREAAAAGYGIPDTVVASPPPIDPFLREMIYRSEGRVGFGAWRPWSGPVLGGAPQPDNMDDPAVMLAAARDDELADLLFWARLPMAEVELGPAGIQVTVRDARYLEGPNSGMFAASATVPN